MGMFIADGIEAIDVTLFGGPPIGALRIPLEAGLTVLYGSNGSGKTTILDGLASALTGVRRAYGGEAYVRCRVHSYWSGFDSTMLLDIARLARRAAAEASISASSDGMAYSDWEEALLGYSEPDLEDPDLDTSLEQWHQVLSRQLVSDLRAVSPLPQPDEPVELTLVAAGSREDPSWLAYTSRALDVQNIDPGFRSLDLGTLPNDETRYFAVHDLARFATSPFEVWTQRTHYLGRLSGVDATRVIRQDDGFDTSRATWQHLDRFLATRSEGLLSFSEGGDFGLSPAAQHELDRMAYDSTQLLRRMVHGAGSLRFVVRHPDDWVGHGLGEWVVVEGDGVEVPLDRQGSAMRRWGRLAVEISTVSQQHDRPVALLLDEPENALHPAAQRQLAEGLKGSADGSQVAGLLTNVGTVVATHSPVLLNTPGSRLLHVHREAGQVRLDVVSGLSDVDRLIGRLDLTRADALLMTRSFVLVEGEHDELVLGELFREEFDLFRARLLAIRGAKNILAALDLELLARYSDAHLVLVVDRLGKKGAEHWEAATADFSSGDYDGAARALHRLERLPGGEATWLAEAGLALLKAQKLDRARLVGLEKRDILEYLPAGAFVPGEPSWASLRSEFNKAGATGDFKQWLRSHKGAKINRSSILNAVGQLDDLDDLPQVLAALQP